MVVNRATLFAKRMAAGGGSKLRAVPSKDVCVARSENRRTSVAASRRASLYDAPAIVIERGTGFEASRVCPEAAGCMLKEAVLARLEEIKRHPYLCISDRSRSHKTYCGSVIQTRNPKSTKLLFLQS